MNDQPSYRPMGGAQRRPVYARRPAALPTPDKGENIHTRHAVLMTGCATALVLAACAASPGAQAQSSVPVYAFQATPTPVSGTVNISRGSTDIIDVGSNTAVIDWQPFDTTGTGTIDFLPTGRTGLFRNEANSGITDFTVLNRILPVNGAGVPVSRVIAFNGAVQSEISGSTGGSVWFYTPGGIIAGPTSTFNVGGLILTTDAISTANNLGSPIQFTGAAVSNSAVQIQSGAQISANSYVALVAPRVVQGGTVTADGSVAYIAAEAADVTINGGLFDIAITTGTGDANGVVHTGTTTGPAAVNGADTQRIYMVAVPKNNALTMLLSGTVGYTDAGSAVQDGSSVILAAGYDVQGDTLAESAGGGASIASGVQFGSGTWQSDVYASANGDIVINPLFFPPTDFAGNVALSATRSITLRATQQNMISAARDMTLTARTGTTGGTIDLLAFGGSGYPQSNGVIQVAGTLNLNVSADGDFAVSSPPLNGANAVAGTVNMIARGGIISAPDLRINATASSGFGTQRSGDAQGGAVNLSALTFAGPIGAEGGTLQFGSTIIDASARAPVQTSFAPLDGGNVTGGTVTFTGTDGTVGTGMLDLGDVDVQARATGGIASTGAGGNATGGNVIVNITSGAHQFNSFNANVSVEAGFATSNGMFGSAGPGATGISFDVSGTGSLNVGSSVTLAADAYGYGGGSSSSTAGAGLQGGQIILRPHDGGALIFGAGLDMYAGAYASSYNGYYSASATPATTGGTIVIGAEGGDFAAAGIYADVSARSANNTGSAGNAVGGNITFYASASGGDSGSFVLTDCRNFGCSAYAGAEGSFGGSGSSGASGSAGLGGSILMYSSDAYFSVGGLMGVYADGRGGGANNFGGSGNSGNGQGGTITIESRAGQNGSGILEFDRITASVNGDAVQYSEGVEFGNGDGGTGSGGTVNFTVSGGTFTANRLELSANGEGGASDVNCPACAGGGTTPFQAGVGQGGTITYLQNGGVANIGTLAIEATGRGGQANSTSSNGAVAALAGDGVGGNVLVDAQAGILNVGAMNISASGVGGLGNSGYVIQGANGGAGFGGDVRLLMDVGSSAEIHANSILLSASGEGGSGASVYADGGGTTSSGHGGAATGGTVGVTLAGGALDVSSITLSADGEGGQGGDNETDNDGGDAGNGAGGTARFAYLSEGHTIGSLMVQANGNGGVAGQPRYVISYDGDTGIYTYGYNQGDGGAGGNGSGGNASMLIDVDPTFTDLTISADGIGSAGGTGGVNGSDGGQGIAGVATLNVNFGTTTVSNNLRVTASALGGVGGDGLAGFGGNGGYAQGGTATVNVSGVSALLDANDVGVLADATGGMGGFAGPRSGPGLAGANGGDAQGGTALFSIADSGIALTGTDFLVSANATGGAGNVGTAGTVGGVGGDGGDATGGSARITIANGELAFNNSFGPGTGALTATANASGGAGADGSNGTGTGATGGNGGNGGEGQAGRAGFDALNGNFSGNHVVLLADGTGGAGGDGGVGPGFPGNPNATPPVPPSGPIASSPGFVGGAYGGAASFVNSDDGAPLASGVSRSVVDLVMSASALLPVCCGNYAGGRVELTDTSTATGGGLAIGGILQMHSGGFPFDAQSGLYVNATANPVTVGAYADLSTDGPMLFSFTGGGRLSVASSLYGYAGSTIDIIHDDRPDAVAGLSAQDIYLSSQGDLTAQVGSSLSAASGMTLTSYQGNITAADLTATDLISLEAHLDVKLVNASVTGPVSLVAGDPFPSGGAIRLIAGSDYQGGYVPTATLTMEGRISATGSVLGRAGSDIIVNTGAMILSDNRIQLEAGDDIIVRTGASVLAARNPIGPVGSANILDDPALLYLAAGNAIRMPNNPGAASILVDGTIGAGDRSVILSAEAIQADANPITSRNLYAYILRAPAPGANVPADDSGTRAECGQGNVCLGVLNAGNIVRIGPLSGTVDLPNQVRVSGSIDASDVVIRARDFVELGGDSVSGSSRLYLSSQIGTVSLANGALLTGDNDLRIFAGGTLTGRAYLRSDNAIGLSVGSGGLTLNELSGTRVDRINANGATLENGVLTLNGPLDVEQFNVDEDQAITAGAIRFGTVNAGGDLNLSGTSLTVSGMSVGGALTAQATGISFGTIRAAGDILLSATTGGISGDSIASTNGAVQLSTFSSANSGDILLEDATAGSFIELLSAGDLEIDTATARGDVILTASNGGSLTSGAIRSGDDVWVSSYGTNPNATLTTGDIISTGLGSDSAASGSATFNQYPNNTGPTGAVVLVRGQGAVSTGNISTPGPVIMVSDTGDISGGFLNGARGVYLFAQGDIAAQRITSTGGPLYVANQSMFLPNLPLAYDGASLAGLTPVKTGGSFSLSGPLVANDITIATAGDLTFIDSVNGRNIRLLSGGRVQGGTLTASGPLTIDGLGGINFARLASGGFASLTADNGAITVSSDLRAPGGVFARARAITLNADDDLRLVRAIATAGDLEVNGDGGIIVGAASASNAIRITARGTARFNGTAQSSLPPSIAGLTVAQSISVASGDIVIEQGARIGVQGVTTALRLDSNDRSRPTFIGGDDATGGYSLSATEMLQLASANIGISGQRVEQVYDASLGSSRTPDLFVRGFTLTAGQGGSLGSNGTLTITTPGKLRVEGAVQITGLGDQGGLTIDARDALEIISGRGSIDLRGGSSSSGTGGSSALGGILTLISDDVIAATQSAISDVAAATTLDERDRRLALTDDVVSEDGILRAGTIRVDVTDGLYIQNTGGSALSARRGFIANAFAISTESDGTEIAINGRLLLSTGAFATGIQAIPLISINGTPGGLVDDYATGSKINGCLIAAPGSCIVNTGFDTRDSLTSVLDPTVAVGRLFSLTLVELRDFVAQGYPPLIDEPVTGAGNDDLWDRQCDPGDASCGAN